MLGNVVSRKIISERLGHGSMAMLLDLCDHANPAFQKAVAQGFEMVLGKAKDGGETGGSS